MDKTVRFLCTVQFFFVTGHVTLRVYQLALTKILKLLSEFGCVKAKLCQVIITAY